MGGLIILDKQINARLEVKMYNFTQKISDDLFLSSTQM